MFAVLEDECMCGVLFATAKNDISGSVYGRW